MTVYKLYAAVPTGTNERAATVRFARDGRIRAFTVQVRGIGTGANIDKYATVELSFGSGSAFTVSNTRQVLAAVTTTTTGAAATPSGNGVDGFALSGLDVPVSADEELFMHIFVDTGMTATGTAFVYVEETKITRRKNRT